MALLQKNGLLDQHFELTVVWTWRTHFFLATVMNGSFPRQLWLLSSARPSVSRWNPIWDVAVALQVNVGVSNLYFHCSNLICISEESKLSILSLTSDTSGLSYVNSLESSALVFSGPSATSLRMCIFERKQNKYASTTKALYNNSSSNKNNQRMVLGCIVGCWYQMLDAESRYSEILYLVWYWHKIFLQYIL